MNIEQYKERFSILIESEMGNVRPILSEQLTVVYYEGKPTFKGNILKIKQIINDPTGQFVIPPNGNLELSKEGYENVVLKTSTNLEQIKWTPKNGKNVFSQIFPNEKSKPDSVVAGIRR